MMTREESEIVKIVYNRFIESESGDWTDIDENLEFFSYLTEEDLIREAGVRKIRHSKGTMKCSQNHKSVECFAPLILEAVEAILNLYEKTGTLHPKNAYVLNYYLVFSEIGLIYSV